MTTYTAEHVTPYRDRRNVDIYPDYRHTPQSMVIHGYRYEPATANPDDCEETYRPVTLEWTRPANGIYATNWQAVNGHRGNRVYVLTSPGATNTYGVMVNGVHIPAQFETTSEAMLFAQHIEDNNTED